MKWFIAITVVAGCSLFALEGFACDGFNGSNKFAFSRNGNNFNSFANAGGPAINYQYAAMRAAQRNAQLKPIRMANAQRTRERKLAALERRVEIRIAKREQQRRETEALEESRQQMLADSRDWTDITGKYTTRARLIASNDEAVQLLKTDGSKVVVPFSRLSMTDRHWLASQEIPRQSEVLLAAR